MTTEQGFIVRTHVIVLERKEAPVYEPKRSDIWVGLVVWVVGMQFAIFYAYGLIKAFQVFLQRVGLGV